MCLTPAIELPRFYLTVETVVYDSKSGLIARFKSKEDADKAMKSLNSYADSPQYYEHHSHLLEAGHKPDFYAWELRPVGM